MQWLVLDVLALFELLVINGSKNRRINVKVSILDAGEQDVACHIFILWSWDIAQFNWIMCTFDIIPIVMNSWAQESDPVIYSFMPNKKLI